MQTNSETHQVSHSAWERHLHRSEAGAPSASLARLKWKKDVTEAYFRAHPGRAEEIVVCEVCTKQLHDCLKEGIEFYAENVDVRKFLESKGIFINKKFKKNGQPLVEHKLTNSLAENEQTGLVVS
jgi:gluconate kinase